MLSTIDMPTFIARHADGAVVVDVREPYEYVAGHVPGAVLTPLSQITHHLSDIPRGVDVYVICQTGNRSQSMADLMTRVGITAHSVNGGTSAWAASGKPLVLGGNAR